MIPWLTPSMIASRASGIFTFSEHLPPRRAERAGRLDVVRRDVANAALDEPDDDGERVEHAGDDAGDDRDRHQVDERDDVDELRQRLQHVVDRPQDLRDARALGRPDAEPDADDDRQHRRDEHLRERVHRRRPLADDADRREHHERRRPPAAGR